MSSSVSSMRLGLTVIPEALKTRPELQLEAAMHIYLFAKYARMGRLFSWSFQQNSGSSTALMSFIWL